ncbi:Ohr family peroxiredoxin [Algoriphagus sp. CAU 1675]|uniref:Ohr family peroxiredoxin n=1 Tax=Algoriphagus sp. CAU 1675 TaxID=3032597 RepID=UPI0023DC43EB|nr:Ohr family peroxiredoxin [Algoriphagus sp. CAU 1675]MDF2156578.1 Ohr family peroxiredoxin [Algoriphagus sp. CAU 1675]
MKKLNIDYTATVINTGGRNGHVRSEDGLIDFKVAMPKEIGGKGGEINAEQLFAAAYASCFGSTLAAVSKKTSLKDSSITANVHLGNFGPGDYGIAVDLLVRIPQASSLDEAQELVDLAHEHCIYSKAIWGNVEVNVKAIE